MKSYDSLKTFSVSPEYRKKFFHSVFFRIPYDSLSFLWTEGNDKYELFVPDLNRHISPEFLRYFQELQLADKKPIVIYSSAPIAVENPLFQNTETAYVKFSYFSDHPVVFHSTLDPCKDIQIVTNYDPALFGEVRRNLLADERFWGGEKRMAAVQEYEFGEFTKMFDRCEHRFFLLNDEPVGYISGWMEDEAAYSYEFYLVALVWISTSLGRDIKRNVAREMFAWLNTKRPPFGAGIYSCNVASMKFTSRNGFLPHFVRYFPWR